MIKILLRPVVSPDVPILFEQQLDRAAVAMADYPSKDNGEFMRHWEGILKNKTAVARIIEYKGRVAGHLLCWKEKYEQRVGYWLGREFWGRGIASAALAGFLKEVKTRPLYAHVANHNAASKRVLEKSGFVLLDEGARITVFKPAWKAVTFPFSALSPRSKSSTLGTDQFRQSSIHRQEHFPMNESSVAEYITKTFPDVETTTNLGYTFFFHRGERIHAFATIASSGNEYEQVSKLDRPGVYRLNIGVSRETFKSLFGTNKVNVSDYDFTMLDTLLPHPDYSAQSFICVLSPGDATFEQIRPLLAEAYDIAVRKYNRRNKHK